MSVNEEDVEFAQMLRAGNYVIEDFEEFVERAQSLADAFLSVI